MNVTSLLLVLLIYFWLVRPLIRRMVGGLSGGGVHIGGRPQRGGREFQAIYIVANEIAHADDKETSQELNAVVNVVRAVMGNPGIPAEVIINDYRRYGNKPWKPEDASGLSMQFRQLLLEVAIGVAVSDLKITQSERKVISHIAATLGFDPARVKLIIDEYEAKISRHAPQRTRSALEFAYNKLGLRPGATPREIKKRYQQLAMKHHPDRAKPEERSVATENFKEIGDAYRILKGQY